MRLVEVAAGDLRTAGPAGDPAVRVPAPGGGVALTTRHPRLAQVVPAWDPARGELALAFPDGSEVAAEVVRGEPVTTALYNHRPVAGHRVEGPFAAALSAHLGKPVE